ncbi:MAG TPA: tRNA (guanosine(46)-N7)-methyltransferase TrmB [Tetrasphaera sp.]|nr:tRNA (guanosine(46)-N7)-methyltransferase TrmB [Tetrasphaera sp.]
MSSIDPGRATAPAVPERSRSPIRTFTPRYRLSDLTRERLRLLLPEYEVRDLPIEPAVVFGRRAPLIMEIGSGHGAAAIGYAASFPDHDVLTAEVHLPGVARMLAAAVDRGVHNLRVYPGDAMNLLGGALAPQSLRSVHVLFPDPWPKAKHAKRRLIRPETLAAIERLLEPDGHLLIATDHPVYAEWTREQLRSHGRCQVQEIARPSWKDEDGFERKGLAAGRPATYLSVRFARRDGRFG